MLKAEKKETLRESLKARLAHSRNRCDELYAFLKPGTIHDRPIPERHRIIFYLGHLEAFDWNLIGTATLGLEPFHKTFDDLFAFGIDPVDGDLPDDKPSDWPSVKEITEYNRRIRRTVDDALQAVDFNNPSHPNFENGKAFHVAVEHRLMHAETLAYMLHWMPYDRKVPQASLLTEPSPPVPHRMIEIPAGSATLGHDPNAASFGWCNEYSQHTVETPAFAIGSHNITNGDYLKFMEAGGYRERSLWRDDDWTWKEAEGVAHPRFWVRRDGPWFYRAMFEEIPLPEGWPVYVSQAEATAYARWAGKELPTEAQFHRAAYGTPEGTERSYPWGEEEPDGRHGNFDFRRWDPTPVGVYPNGESAFGVADLLGNGWEWTSTIFAPFEGFEPLPFYPNYSANFFDGKHYVIKGGSARTGAPLLRRSFRNWFQAHYPHIYSSFRLVENSG